MPNPFFVPVRTPAEKKLESVMQRDLKDKADEVLSRPNARFQNGMWNPRVVNTEDVKIVARVYPKLPEQQGRPGKAISGFEALGNLGGRALMTGQEAIAETGLATTQALADIGPKGPALLPFLNNAERERRSRESFQTVKRAVTGKQPVGEAITELSQRQRERPLPEQFTAGAIYDPLNLLPGVGYGPEIARGVRVVAKAAPAVGRAALRGAESALVRAPGTVLPELGLKMAGGQAVAGGAERVKRLLGIDWRTLEHLREKARAGRLEGMEEEHLRRLEARAKATATVSIPSIVKQQPVRAGIRQRLAVFNSEIDRAATMREQGFPQHADEMLSNLRVQIDDSLSKGLLTDKEYQRISMRIGSIPPTKPVAPAAETVHPTRGPIVPSRQAEGQRLDEALAGMEEAARTEGPGLLKGETQAQYVKRRLAEFREDVAPFRLDVPSTRKVILQELKEAEAAGGVRAGAQKPVGAVGAPSPAAPRAVEVSVPVRRTRARVKAPPPQQGAPEAVPGEAAGVPPSPAAAPPPVPPRRPRTRQQPPPPPEEPFAANIRLSKYPEDIRGPIADWAAENASVVQEVRRGIRSDAQVLADARVLVEEMGGDFARIQRRWKPGEAWNAEEITAIRGVLRQRTQAVLDAAKASRASNSDENLANLMIALKEQSRVQEIVHGVTAEAGRSLRAFRQASQEMAVGGEVARFEELLQRLGGRENLSKWADLISTLDLNDPVAVNNFIRMTQRRRFMDYLTEYFINSILSGPASHMKNALGNTGALLAQFPERGLAAGVERVLAPVQGRAIERFWDEVPAAAIGALQGLDEGVRGALQVLKTGQRLQEATKMELLEFRPRAFTGPLGRVINAPTNAMEAADAFFYSPNFRASLGANIIRQARSEGLTGQRLIDRIALLKSTPTQGLLERAAKEAETRLFRNDPGPFVSEIMRLRTKYPPLRFIVPFVRTPANLITFGLARSPAGFLNPGMYRNLAAKNPEAADQIARALMGSMVAGAIAWQFTQGNITAQAPSSAAERDRFYREGKQPWSIRIMGHWVSYRDFEPFSITFGLIGSAMTAIEESGEDAADATEVVGRAVTEMGRFLLDRSFFTGLSDTLNAVQEPERYGSQWLQRMAGAAVPFSALLRQIAQTADPTFRKPKGVVESLKANIPGLTGQVPEKVTAFGETPKRPSPALFPVAVSKGRQSAVDAELGRLGIEVGFVGKTIEGEELSRSQQLQYQRIAGQETLKELEKVIGKASYQDDTEAKKQDKIEDAINDARKEARRQMEKLMKAGGTSQPTPSTPSGFKPTRIPQNRARRPVRTPVGAGSR